MGARITADEAIAWIEDNCRIPEGKDVGKPVKLRPWQRDILRMIYDNPHGTRQAIISMPRKNAKTALIAFLLLLHLVGPAAKPNSQLYSAAVSQDQAATVYKLAAKIVRMSPVLSEYVIPRDTRKELACPEMGTIYAALSAEKKTAHGKSPIFAVHDELGQVTAETSELYDAVETGMGAHEEPLSIVISTQAPNDSALLSRLIDNAATGADPKTVLKLYAAPVDADPFSEETLKACNPAWGDFLNAADVLRTRDNAKGMPQSEASYRNLHLNQRVETTNPFVSETIWKACGAPPVDSFKDLPVYAGLDLSRVRDLTAFVAVAPVDGVWHVKPTFWLPQEGLVQKARSDLVPYDLWEKQGFLSAPRGASIDYRFVASFICAFLRENDVRKIYFDRALFDYLKPLLIEGGLTEAHFDGDEAVFEKFGQGTMSMHPALLALESALLDRRIAHGNHPVLANCAHNAVVVEDDAGSRKLSKRKSSGRIDGMVALAMAMAAAGTWEKRDVMNIDDFLSAPIMVI